MSGFKAAKVICLILFPISVMAQTSVDAVITETTDQFASNSLRGKHSIQVSAGLLTAMNVSTEVSEGDVTVDCKENGLIGSVAYTYWLENNLGVNLSVGVISAGVSTSVNDTDVIVETATVIPMLFGVKFQPFRFTDSNSLRPYLSVSAGPYLGFASNVRTGSTTATECISEAALGSRVGAGVDLSLGRLFTLGVGTGYCFVTDFENRIGTNKNYSSPDFSLSFGIVLGKGKN